MTNDARGPVAAPLDAVALARAFQRMALIRAFEERLHVENTTGDIPGFVHLYEQHIAREEAELLPMAARLLSDAELDRIGVAMRHRRQSAIVA